MGSLKMALSEALGMFHRIQKQTLLSTSRGCAGLSRVRWHRSGEERGAGTPGLSSDLDSAHGLGGITEQLFTGLVSPLGEKK